MTGQKIIQIADLAVSNEAPFTLFGGINVLESRELALEVAAAYKEATSKLGILRIQGVFRQSQPLFHLFLSRTWIGKGLGNPSEIKQTHAVPVISDAHEPHQAKPAAEIIDALQLPPSFAARRLVALCRNRTSVNAKKAQFLQPMKWDTSSKSSRKR